MSIWHLHGKIPCGVQFCSYLWINNCIDHLNILHLHGLRLRELLKWLVLWLVNHTGYRNRIHSLGTPFKVLKTRLLPYITRSIFRIVFFNVSKNYFLKQTGLSAHISFVSIIITCKSILGVTLFNLSKTISFRKSNHNYTGQLEKLIIDHNDNRNLIHHPHGALLYLWNRFHYSH